MVSAVSGLGFELQFLVSEDLNFGLNLEKIFQISEGEVSNIA